MPKPPSKDYRAPSARAIPSDSWTLDLIRQAELAADGGNLRWAADLCDALLGDDRVQGAREKLAGLFGLPLRFEDGVGRMRRRAKRALEVEEDWWSAFSDESLVELLTWAVLLGVALAQVQWTRRHDRDVPRLVVWHPRALRWDPHEAVWKVRLFDGSEVPIVEGSGEWVVFTPRAEHEPWKHGAWRAIARWWRAKRYALTDWGKHSEQASGLKVATTEDGTDADRLALANDLSDAGADAAVVLPPRWELTQLAVPSSTVDVFDRLIDAADDAITIALLGQNLTTEVKGGSFAAATVHQAVASTVLRSLASSLAAALHDQVLVPWAVFNFESAEVAPWPVWDVEPPADRTQDAQVLDTRTRAAVAMAGQGAPVDWRKFAEENGIPLRAPEEEVLTAGAPIYGYHLQYGIETINEARARVGLPPIPDGNRAPTPPEPNQGAVTAPAALSAATPLLPAERRALAGQVYVDAVFDAAMKRAPAALDAGILGAVQRAVREARDYETLRAELTALVKDTDDTALQELILGAVMCCAGAGAFTTAEP